MPFDADTGVYTPPSGAENAFPGKVIASAVWNAIFTDIAAALTQFGEVFIAEPTVETTAGPFTIADGVGLFALNKGSPSATSLTLPAVADRNGLLLIIIDWAGNAGDITINAAGSETIMGLATWVLTSTGGAGFGAHITLKPSVDLDGWLVVSQ